MDWLQRKGRALINAALAIMMVALYVTITVPKAKSAISELYNSPVYRGHKQGTVALECAVSWNAEALAEMLELLHERGVRITFLVSGDWARDNTEMLSRIVRDGHEVGTLGMTPGKDGGVDDITADVESSVALIREMTGIKPALYYSGARGERSSAEAASRLDITHVLCTVDLLSGRGTAEDILLRALDKPFDGSIILIQPTREAVKALPACIEGLKQQGFGIGTVGEVLQ